MNREGRGKAGARVALAGVVVLVLGVAAWWALSGPLAALGDRKIVRPADVAACGPAWRWVESPNPSKEYSEFHSISALTGADIWAVGTNGTEEYALTLTEHWDGREWAYVQSPSVANFSNHLYSVATVASDDVWTVGASHRGTDLWRTLTMHWDGRNWTIVPSPTVPPVSNFNSVAAVASDNVWAVGEQSTGARGAGPQPLLARWDGHSWSLVSVAIPVFSGTLNGVTAIAADDIWAAGSFTDSPTSASRPLILHFDGKQWRQVQAPGTGELYAVSGSSRQDVWAVGNNHQRTLALHWDGHSWSTTPTPNPGNKADVLEGVVSVGKGDTWAVGALSDDEGDATVALHWDGKSWSHFPSPSKGPNADTLSGVTRVEGAVWAAGSYIADASGTNLTIMERFSDPCAK